MQPFVLFPDGADPVVQFRHCLHKKNSIRIWKRDSDTCTRLQEPTVLVPRSQCRKSEWLMARRSPWNQTNTSANGVVLPASARSGPPGPGCRRTSPLCLCTRRCRCRTAAGQRFGAEPENARAGWGSPSHSTGD
jgi:hypothetical protein